MPEHSERATVYQPLREEDVKIPVNVTAKKSAGDYRLVFYDVECEQEHDGLMTMWTAAVYCTLIGWICNVGRLTTSVVDHGVPCFVGRTVEEFLEMICSLPSQVYVMAFNGFAFDHLYMFNRCRAMKTLTVNPGSIQEGGVIVKGKSIVLKDMMRYISYTSIKKLGDQLNCPKIETGNAWSDIKYCARDTVILAKSWFEVVLPMWAPVIGILCPEAKDLILFSSQAQIAYRFMIFGVPNLYGIGANYFRAAKLCYYGARIDSCIMGKYVKAKVGLFDIRSFYPASMLSMPVGSARFLSEYECDPKRPFDYLPFICCVEMYKREGDLLDGTFGVIPVRTKTGVIYTSYGKIRGVYTVIDIWNAILDGWTIKKMWNFILWESWSDDIRDKYRYWYNEKTKYKKDTVLYWFVKQILNSSIGMFAVDVIDKPSPRPNQVNWFCMSYMRRQLMLIKNVMRRAKIQKPLYSDTDSIMFFFADLERFLDMAPNCQSMELGGLNTFTGEVEKISDYVIVLAKKIMMMDGKVSCKGHALSQLSKELFEKALESEQKTERWSPRRFARIDDGTLYCGCSMFLRNTVTLRVVVPIYKTRCGNVFINKFIVVQYVCSLRFYSRLSRLRRRGSGLEGGSGRPSMTP